MAIIKNLIRKTPIIKLWRSYNSRKDYNRLMKYNNEYKSLFDSMLDPDVLDNALEEFERVRSNADTVYLIGMYHERTGIFGYINNYLPHILYAVLKGYIPVIDMKNFNNIYKISDENAWENYFLQPCDIGLDNNFKNIIHCPHDLWYRWAPNSYPLMSDAEIKMWGTVYEKFVRYNEQSKKYLNDEMDRCLPSPEKTVGVIYRGTDYTLGKPPGCPIQPTKKMLADKVEEIMKRNNLEYVYIASDERDIVDYLNERFPGKVLINKRVYYDEATNVDYSNYNNDQIGISGAHFERENNQYLIGIEYISTINLVSHCSCFVAGACGGTTAALYLNNGKYKEKYIFQLGKYGLDSEPEDQE